MSNFDELERAWAMGADVGLEVFLYRNTILECFIQSVIIRQRKRYLIWKLIEQVIFSTYDSYKFDRYFI